MHCIHCNELYLACYQVVCFSVVLATTLHLSGKFVVCFYFIGLLCYLLNFIEKVDPSGSFRAPLATGLWYRV